MMVNWKFAWREARQRPGRSILTLLSIVIGVAAVVAVTIASGTTRQSFNQIYETVAGRASLVISGALGSSFDENIADKVREIPGVQAVAPLLKRPTLLYVGKKKQYRLVALGIDPRYDQQVRNYEVVEGKRLRRLEKLQPGQKKYPPPPPGEGDGVLLGEEFAHNAGIKLDQKVEISTRSGLQPPTVIGFYKSRGAASMAEGAPVVMALVPAQHFWKSYDKIDSAQIVLKPDADEETVSEQIAKLLPTGVSVHPPETRSP